MALKKKKKEKKLSFLLSVPLKLSITSCGLRSLTPTSQPFAEIHLSPNQRLFLSPTALKALTTNICWAHPMAQNCACRIQMGHNTLLWQSVLSREREPFGVRPGEQVLQSNDTHMGDKLKGKTNIKSVLVRPEQLQCALALIRQVPGALPEGRDHFFFFFFFQKGYSLMWRFDAGGGEMFHHTIKGITQKNLCWFAVTRSLKWTQIIQPKIPPEHVSVRKTGRDSVLKCLKMTRPF